MQLGRKIGFSLLLKNESNQLSKTSCTSRKTKLHQKRLKFTCKCEACSKCISQTNIEVLVHKRWLQKPLQHHAKFRKRPKTYQSQMLFHHSAANPELCTKKTLLSPNSSCHTKSCRNVAHVHRINGSLYFHTPFCYDSHAAWLRKFPTCSTMHCICIHIIRKTIVRIRTRSHLFPAVADVSKYLCTLIIPVSSLLSVSAYSLMQKS